MASNCETKAYIIHRRTYRETSYIVVFFSEEFGKFSAVVRGVKGSTKLSLQKQSWLQPFRSLQVSWQEKQNRNTDLVSLRHLEPASTNSIQLKKDANICGLYMNELLYRLLYPRAQIKGLFQDYQLRLQQLSDVIDNDKKDMSWILRQFEFNLLTYMGYGFECHIDVFQEQIKPQKKYLYYPEIGLIPVNELGRLKCSVQQNIIKTTVDGVEVTGECILYLQDWQRNDACLAVWKRLFRQALVVYLGTKPIMSRQFFI